ncbi:MAG: adenosylcobinamide-GDP ribazoletransferase [Bryobacteraceae bacterium]
MIGRLLGAIQFLTVIAIPGKTATPGRSAPFFPVVGALLGAVCGSLFELGRTPFGASLAALIALSIAIAITGGLHEDGLADCADALRAGRTREKMLAILKDSRIGAYGGIALILGICVRWQAITHLQVNASLGLASSLALSRSSMVVLGAITKPVGSGLGAAFAQGLTPATSVVVAVQIVIAASLCGWRGVPMLLSSCVIVALAQTYFTRRLGGVNGDCLGATCLIVESANLLLLAWHSST